jgi:tripartite-type tricarboxylate transporter receptor subunit TctC
MNEDPSDEIDAESSGGKADGFGEEGGTPFYEGKEITLLVGFAAGGGYDRYARLTAEHLPRFIDGTPTITVVNQPNVVPGSSVTAEMAQTLFDAEADGLTLGSFYPTIVLQERIGTGGITFEPNAFGYIGTPAADPPACVIRTAVASTLEEVLALDPPPVIGNTGPGSPGQDMPKILNAATGSNLQVATPVATSAAIASALAAGTVDGGCWTWGTMKTQLAAQLESGAVIPFVAVEGIADLADVPTIEGAVVGTGLEEAVVAWAATYEIQRPIAAPPGLIKKRLRDLRRAYRDMVRDDEFIAAATAANLELSPLRGAQVENIVDMIQSISDEDAATLADILE